MRLAMLNTSDGPRLVSVISVAGADRFLDLAALDDSLPGCLMGLLSDPEWRSKLDAATQNGSVTEPLIEGELLAPIASPGKVICIGLNYRDHAIESGSEIPIEPVCFSKFSSAVVGPNDEIRLPNIAKKVDYEAELVAVIGKRGKNISQADAFTHVAGYTVGHDVSARDWQLGRPGGQWLMGKTADTFAPIGPWMVTADEIADPHALDIKLRLNGETMQDSNTKEFIFGVDELIAHLSHIVTLEPGDIIFTGTPPGVGGARKPPVYLQPGDECEVEIEGIGILRNPVDSE